MEAQAVISGPRSYKIQRMQYQYSMCGLRVRSEKEIPGAFRVTALGDADTIIEFCGPPSSICLSSCRTAYISDRKDESGVPGVTCLVSPDNSLIYFRYRDGVQVWVNRSGSRIWVHQPEHIGLQDIAVYVLGPVLGFVLRLKGVVSLHASAVNIDGQAVAITGPSGSGKSTTAAQFASEGYRIISDDVVALADHRDQFSVQPGCTHLRLCSGSVTALFGSPDALPLVTPTWDKRCLSLPKRLSQPSDEPLPLHAIYVLGNPTDHSGSPSIAEIAYPESLMTLVSNTYTNYLLDSSMRGQEFELLSRMVRSVPIRRVTPSQDIAELDGLVSAIIHDFRKLAPGAISMLNVRKPSKRQPNSRQARNVVGCIV